MKNRILVVDDSREERDGMSGILSRVGPDVEVDGVASGKSAMTAIGYKPYDLAVVDYVLGEGFDGLKVLAMLKQQSLTTEVILVSASMNVPLAVKAMKAGAFDVLSKPVGSDELIRSCQDALAGRRLASRVREAVGGVFQPRAARAEGELIGDSPVMKELRDQVRKYASRAGTPVLIVGETGTGKDLVARALHALSPRAEKLFVPQNCAAMPPQLLESSLFGTVKGAFTGAVSKGGVLETAAGGTVFLDEMNSLGLEQQAKLLRVLETGDFQRLGEEGHLRKADVRFVFAMNEDPVKAIRSGKLREDLFNRLCRLRIDMPPLRDHLEDVRALVAFHAEREAKKEGVKLTRIDDGVFEEARGFSWKGNVRQLVNVVATAMIDSVGPNGELTREAFKKAAGKLQVEEMAGGLDPAIRGGRIGDVREEIDGRADEIIWDLWVKYGDRRKIEKETGLSKATVNRRLKRIRERKGLAADPADDAGDGN